MIGGFGPISANLSGDGWAQRGFLRVKVQMLAVVNTEEGEEEAEALQGERTRPLC